MGRPELFIFICAILSRMDKSQGGEINEKIILS